MVEDKKIKSFICKTCGIEVQTRDFGRFINFAVSLNDRCKKCTLERDTSRDRTGRSSKKDKYKNKSEREWQY